MPSAASQVPADLRARYVAAGQEHVFKFLDEGKLTPAQADGLVNQLAAIDVELVNELFTATMAATAADTAPVSAKLAPAEDVTSVSDASPDTLDAWRAAGLKAIAAGRVGALILAGGQGTRLGFDKPKGLYDVRLPSHKPLFALQCQRITKAKALAAATAGVPLRDVSLPLYVMTSPMTDADTRAFFAEQRNFGLPPADVRFFSQGTLPCLSFDGKILLESGGAVAEAPDGNGGIYRALHLSGVVADLQRRGIEGVHVWAVDNAVVRTADPVFLGYCLGRGADVGSKVCAKAGPHEKVGVLCRRDGAYTVVEYSEMDRATAELTTPPGPGGDAGGRLVFNAGNICIHYYSTAFLAGPCSPAALPKVYHVAKKAIPYADPAGDGEPLSKEALKARHASTGGNSGVKLESFIFDVFPASRAMAALEIARGAEFSPVKNAPGAADDSPDTARAIVTALHAGWLTAAGAALAPEEGGAAGSHVCVEVSPLASYGGEGLEVLAGHTLATPALVLADGEPLPPGASAPGALDDVTDTLPGGAGVTHFVVTGVDLPGATSGKLHIYRLPRDVSMPTPLAGSKRPREAEEQQGAGDAQRS